MVNQVDDELHLVDALKVCVARIVAGLGEDFEAGLHQLADAAAENGLLAEEVGLGLGAEGGLKDARTGGADAGTVGQSLLKRLAGRVLVDGDEAGGAAADLVLAADGVARSLRGDHGDIDILRRNDLAKMDVEAMREHEHVAGLKVRGDVFLVKARLKLVVDQDHDDIGLLCGFGGGVDREALLFGALPGLTALVKADDDVKAGLLEVQRVGMALAAVADDGDFLSLKIGKVAVFLIIDLRFLCHFLNSPL